MIAAVMAAVVVAAFPVHVTTQNVRVGMPRPHALHDIRQAADVGGIVFTQEMRDRRARDFRPRGWGSAQATRPRVNNRGDCATYWDRGQWRRVGVRVFPYEFAPFKNGHRAALVTVLRSRANPRVTLATVNVHSITRSLDRRAVFRRGMARLGRLTAHLTARWGRVVIGGDWNRVWRLRARFDGFRSWSPARATGPQGGRVDYLLFHGIRARSLRIVGHTYSDHNGVRMTFGRPRAG